MRNFSPLWGLLLSVFFAACATPVKPLKDPTHPAVKELVDLRAQDQGLRFDIRYSTSSNFTGQRLYPVPAAWLRQDAARALASVHRDLQKEGLGLKIFDAYRPFHVQQQMWNLVHDERYVSNPAKNAGRHTRGTAVDVTLVDRRGRELPMPTAFDDFTERAHRDAVGISPEAKANSLHLERAMARHGFIPYPFEWWHFDYSGWGQHPPLDIALTDLAPRKSPVTNAAR